MIGERFHENISNVRSLHENTSFYLDIKSLPVFVNRKMAKFFQLNMCTK